MEIINNKSIKLADFRNIHFVGIGGISMSALATLCIHLGFNVSGSDLVINEEVDRLQRLGVGIAIGHKRNNIDDMTDLVVYSGAVNNNNEELKEACFRKLLIMERSEFLGLICANYKKVIAISGSHGKTTTTAMIGHIFKSAKLNPTIHLGGNTKEFGNLHVGGNDYFITEACEYRNSMQYIYSDTAVVTNIDNDHLDYYKTKKNLVKAFQNFANKSSSCLIVGSSRNFRQQNRKSKLISAGINNNQSIFATNINKTKKGYIFNVVYNHKNLGKFKLNIWGKHNIKNAIYAIAVALQYNIGLRKIKLALKTFSGVCRRYQVLGKYKNVKIVSDYAHHPTEIKNSISGIKAHHKNVLLVFQPHTYSRTKILIKEFAGSFRGVKDLIIYKTYPARENYDNKGDEKSLFNAITNKSKFLACDKKEIVGFIDKLLKKHKIDIVVVMGAGDLPINFTDLVTQT